MKNPENKDNESKEIRTDIPEELIHEALEAVESHSQKKEKATASGAAPSAESDSHTRDSELVELKDRYLRLAAEFENYKKRIQKEKTEMIRYSSQGISRQLLEIVDNLERALKSGDENGDFRSLHDGVELILRQLKTLLEREGVREIDCLHQEFDPAYHEALCIVESADLPPDHVHEISQKGYMIHDRLLRPAKVVITKEKEADEQPKIAPPEDNNL